MLFLTFMLNMALIILLIALWDQHRQLSTKVEQLQKELVHLRAGGDPRKETLSTAPDLEKEELPNRLKEKVATEEPPAPQWESIASSPAKAPPMAQAPPPLDEEEKELAFPSGAEETPQQPEVAAVSKPGLSEPSDTEVEKKTPPAISETTEGKESSLTETPDVVDEEKSFLAPPLSAEESAPDLAAATESEGTTIPEHITTKKPIDWELLIGGKWLNRIGALALFISLAFFLKYAFDQNWLNEIVRVSLGGITGLSLLYGGYRANRNQLAIFAQGLVGAGIAILYVTVYAFFNFYHLMPQSFALLLMSGITILAFHQAMNYNSLAVALLGWTGGFLTPFLVSTGEASTAGLFTFLSILVIGILLVLTRREKWIILYPLSMVTTYLIYGSWFLLHYQSELFFSGAFFLALFWGMFLFFDLWGIIRQIQSYPILRRIFCGINAAFFALYMTALIRSIFPVWSGATTLAVGALYLIIAQVLRKRTAARPVVLQQYTLTAILFATVATVQEFSGYTLTILFSLEATALTWYGIRTQSRYLWITALGLFGAMLFQLLIAVGIEALPGAPITPIWNMQTLAFFTLAGALGIAAFLFQRATDTSRSISISLQLAAVVVLILWTILEFSGFTLTILLSLEALALIFFGLQSKRRSLWITGLALFGVTILQLWVQLGIEIISGESVTSIWNMQTLAFFILVGSLGGAAHLFQRSAPLLSFIPKGLHIGWTLLLLQWSMLEFSGYELTLILSLHGLLLIWYGMQSQGRYMWIAGLSIFGITTLQLLLTLCLHPLSESPLDAVWNIRTLAFFTLTASLLISSLQFRHSGTSETLVIHKALQFSWIFLIVLWSLLEFSGFTLSLLFALQALALVWYGIRLQSRHIWGTALSLFGISILHLLFQTAVELATPQENYIPLWNMTTLAYITLIGSLIITIFLFRRVSHTVMSVIRKGLHIGWTLLLYIWCTIEVRQLFQSLALDTSGDEGVHLQYTALFAMTAAWLLCSLPLLRLGLQRRNKTLFFVGNSGLSLAAVLSAFWALFYHPIAFFTPILNLRFFVIILIAIGAYLLGKWLVREGLFAKVEQWSRVIHVGIALLIFELISVEIWDGFAEALFLLGPNEGGTAHQLENMKQLAISLAWILYSFILMVIGIWRKMKTMRILAFSLFGLSILKIFIFDLAFLDTLYRIFSFMILGLILLGVSYVYGKYRDWFKLDKES